MAHKFEQNNLVGEIMAAYETRLAFVKSIVEDTERSLEDFRVRREQLSSDLRELLGGSVSLRKTDFDRMMAEVLAVQRQREENVTAVLREFREAEERIAERLQKLAVKGETVTMKDFKRVLTQIKKEQGEREHATALRVSEQIAQMQHEVHGMLGEFKQAREKIAAEWQARVAVRS